LNGSHDIRLLGSGGFAKRRGPGEILRQIIKDGRKLRQSLDGRVPCLLIYRPHERLASKS
jgi:hypothetical protein